MGWKDDPVATSQPKWAADPVMNAPSRQVGMPEAAFAGLTQGASMGFGDEIKAGWRSLFGQDYKTNRDQLRAENKNAQQQHPYAYGAGEVAGGALPAAGMGLATGGTAAAPMLAKAALPLAAGQGALQGAGLSNADSAGGMARDAAVGGGLGVAGYGVGQALGGAGRSLLGSIRGLGQRAVGKASEKAASEVTAAISSARGSLGGEVQKGQRIVENLRRLGPDLNPEQQAFVDQLEQRLTASTLESLPGQAGTIATKDAELAALKSGALDTFNARKADLLSGAEAGRQLKARLLRYGPPAVMGALGTLAGGPAGSAVGTVAGIAARPAFQSLRRLSQNPAVQKQAADFLTSDVITTPGELLRQLLARGAPALATQELVSQ